MDQGSARPQFDTRIAVVVQDDLEVWQKLNVTSFVVSGITASADQLVGEPYEDGSGKRYLPMLRQPIMVYSASRDKLGTIFNRATRRDVELAIYTEELFTTYNDEENRAAVKAVPTDELAFVGLAFRTDRKDADKILKGISLHR